MKLRILKQSSVGLLREKVADNLEHYLTGNFDLFFADPIHTIELDLEVDYSLFATFTCGTASIDEVPNCLLMHEALGHITPYLARDERLWVYLTHTYLLEYARKRWELHKKQEDSLVQYIKTHFFGSTKRGIERDNAASRLWWISMLCSRVDGLALEDSLKCFLKYSDVRASVIERPTASQCTNVFSAIIKKLFIEYQKPNSSFADRNQFRSLMREINLHGGVKLLNTLPENEITLFIEQNSSC